MYVLRQETAGERVTGPVRIHELLSGEDVHRILGDLSVAGQNDRVVAVGDDAHPGSGLVLLGELADFEGDFF